MKRYITSEHITSSLANLPQLVFEVTDACNLNCKYCAYGKFYDDYDSRENKVLPVEKAVRLIDWLTEFWNSDLNASTETPIFISFYGGEPLLNVPFIKTIVNHIENKVRCPNRKFQFSMTSNALLLHKYVDYLKEHDFFLLVSLDGNRENTGYRVDKSGVNAFDRVVANVDALKKKYPEYFNKRVSFNAVLHNKNSVEEIYRFFKDRYDKIPSINELNNVGIHKGKTEEFNRTYRNYRESLYQSEHYEEIEREMFISGGTYQSVNLFLHQYSGFVFMDYTDLLFDKSNAAKTIPTGTCLPFSKKMYITVNGKILPCERIGHQFALGEIGDTEVILNVEEIAGIYNTRYAKLEKQCSKCKNAKACIQCMFNIGDLDEKPVCYGFMNEEAFRDYVNAQMRFLEKNPEAYKRLMEEVFVF